MDPISKQTILKFANEIVKERLFKENNEENLN